MKKKLIFGILIISFKVMAQDYSPKNITSSPFSWSVSIDQKRFTGSEINELLKRGTSVNNGKIKCTFEFNTDWSTKKEVGDMYSERLWLQCMIGDVRIAPNAVGCSKYKGSDPEMDSLSIGIGSSSVSMFCSSYRKK